MKLEELLRWKEQALSEARSAADLNALESVRIRYLGRKGLLPEIMGRLKEVPPSDRKEYGRVANAFKEELHTLLEQRRNELLVAKAEHERSLLDPTLPGRWLRIGTRHPVSQIIERTIEIFTSIGFTVADGPDIETDWYNFDALNTPADHPSRDIQDTFYLPDGRLLRTQTSPVQIRVMEKQRPPVRVIAPGRCYRRDTTDATHSANFHQIEGLYVDRRVSLADLKGDLTYFAQELMGRDVRVRLRPHYFPFTEPSVEYDFSCHVCKGAGCRLCKYSGWIEISGAGMVHPKVLRNVGYDPEEYTGYAFGMGVERIAMIMFGIPDIRMLYDNDLRFLSQF